MSIMKKAGGVGLWLGTFQFDSQHCINHLRLSSNVPMHISEVLASAYDEFGELDITELGDYRLLERRRNYLMEENPEPFGKGVGKGYGSIELLIESTEYPLVHWAKDIAARHSDIDVQLDYQNLATDDFGRVLIRRGELLETHMRPQSAIFIPL